MKFFQLKPIVHTFSCCQDFINEFSLGKTDFILASKSNYAKHFQHLNLDLQAKVVFKSDYGPGEPTDLMCESIMDEVRTGHYTRIIAIGGGAVIDLAKVLAVTGEASIDDLYQQVPNLEKRRKLVIVPTTCGTGSEVTNISILSRTRINTKAGLVSDALFPDDAVLIPELLTDLPFSVFATSSLDALVHAVESALSPKANEMTRIFSYQAITMILRGYCKIVEYGDQMRTSLMHDFLLASTYAGIAFSNAGCATVHALSYPLGTICHVPHGESNYAIFPGVIQKYQQLKPEGEILILAGVVAEALSCHSDDWFEALDALLSRILRRKHLHEYGVEKADLVSYTESVLTNQQRLLNNSFIPVNRDDILDIYQSLF